MILDTLHDLPRSERAIAMVSVGECRFWSKRAEATLVHYAARVNASFHVLRIPPELGEFPLTEPVRSRGRKDKRIYALKHWLPWKLITERGLQRVLVIDDSCMVVPIEDDIFEACPPGTWGYTRTSAEHAKLSLSTIHALQKRIGEPLLPLATDLYVKTGVILYDRAQIDAISPDRIVAAADLLQNKFPSQTHYYFLTRTGGVQPCAIPKAWNRMPSANQSTSRFEARSLLADFTYLDIIIGHVTGGYEHRGQIIEELSEHCLRLWQAEIGGKDRPTEASCSSLGLAR